MEVYSELNPSHGIDQFYTWPAGRSVVLLCRGQDAFPWESFPTREGTLPFSLFTFHLADGIAGGHESGHFLLKIQLENVIFSYMPEYNEVPSSHEAHNKQCMCSNDKPNNNVMMSVNLQNGARL